MGASFFASTMPKWGEFQSLIQLGVTLNAAFAAFGTYFGNNIDREGSKLLKIVKFLDEGAIVVPKAVRAHGKFVRFLKKKIDSVFKTSELGDETRVIILEGKVQSISLSYSNFVGGIFAVLCIAFAITGMGFLLYSSVFAGKDIKDYNIWYIIGLYIPFFFGVLRLLCAHLQLFFSVTLPRRSISKRLKYENEKSGPAVPVVPAVSNSPKPGALSPT
jgi:hypothetical protein